MSDERDVIQARLRLLDDYTRKLRDLQATDFQEYVSNFLIHKTVERLLETAIQACLDVSRHLIAEGRFRYPEENKEVFLAKQRPRANAALRTPRVANAKRRADIFLRL